MSNVPTYPPPPRSNGLGIAGFIISLLGVFSLGLLSPVGLLLSFFALFRAPRGMAFAGFIIGLLGTLFIAAVVALFGWGILKAVRFGKPMIVTVTQADHARKAINAYYITNGRNLPDDLNGALLISADRDGWGHPFQYRRVSAMGFEIRSAGMDGIFATEDDFEQIFDAGVSP